MSIILLFFAVCYCMVLFFARRDAFPNKNLSHLYTSIYYLNHVLVFYESCMKKIFLITQYFFKKQRCYFPPHWFLTNSWKTARSFLVSSPTAPWPTVCFSIWNTGITCMMTFVRKTSSAPRTSFIVRFFSTSLIEFFKASLQTFFLAMPASTGVYKGGV